MKKIVAAHPLLLAVFVFLAVVLPPRTSAATQITFAFQGIVTAVNPLLGGTFDTTQTMFGSYTFESTTPDTTGWGEYSGAIKGFTVTIGAYSPSFNPFGIREYIEALNGSADSYVAAVDVTGPGVNGHDLISFGIVLFDSTGSALANKSLPLAPPNLSAFNFPQWSLFFSDIAPNGHDRGARVDGTITSLKLVATAVPGAGPLVYSGASILGLITYALKARWARKSQERA